MLFKSIETSPSASATPSTSARSAASAASDTTGGDAGAVGAAGAGRGDREVLEGTAPAVGAAVWSPARPMVIKCSTRSLS